MTDPIGDALNTNTPAFDTPELVAEWKELPPGYYAASVNSVNIDNLAALGSQLGPQGFSVDQSMIDGLPDNVSMTGSNDGYGKLTADLTGRPPNRSRNFGSRGASNSGTGTTVTASANSGTGFMDLQVVSVAFNSTTVTAVDANADPYDRFGWKPLAEVIEGGIKMVMYWRYWYTGAPSLVLNLSESVSYTWQSTSYWATEASSGTWVHLSPGTPVLYNETVSQTLHTLPSLDLGAGKRGWFHAHLVCLTANGPWTAGPNTTELSDIAGSALNITAIRSASISSRLAVALAASTTTATDVVGGIIIPVIYNDRVEMTAGAYFSPYRRESPLYGFDRDTAPVRLTPKVITSTGAQGKQIFTGTMSNIQVGGSGASASLTAASQTRVNLDKARVPPIVWGRREGLTIDWFANWLMAQGGQTVGPGPNQNTRLYSPFYGSTRSYCWGVTDWDEVGRLTTDDLGNYQRHWYPQDVAGPYVSAVFGKWTNDEIVEPHIEYARDTRFRPIPGIDQPDYHDFMSQQSYEGRWSAWVRCDPYMNGSPAALNGDTSRNYLFQFYIQARSRLYGSSVDTGGVTFTVDPTIVGGAQPWVAMGTSDGYTTIYLTGLTWPTDGQWHFIGGSYNFLLGEMKFRFDNLTWSADVGASAGAAKFSNMYATEDDNYRAGGYVLANLRAHLPMSDFKCDTGPGMHANPWSGVWPKPTPTVVYRRTGQWMEALAETTPLAGWETLQQVAQATGSALRINELDRLEFMPQEYFGETDQLEIASVADTELNASAIDVSVDPSKSRNVITVQYADVVTDSRLQEVLKYQNSLLIRPGVHELTLSSDMPVLELHGANNPFAGSLFVITALTATQIASPTTIPTVHYMTVSSKADGSGTVPPASYVTGRVVGLIDANTVKVRIVNSTRVNYYLANNGTEVSFLRILGYSLKVSDAYVTSRDEISIRSRGERTLDHQTPWVQRSTEALELAGRIGGAVSVPRGEATITVMGDPRLKPGQLVTIKDSVGTQAEGTWRILAANHSGAGPQYTVTLNLVRIGEPMIWDGDPGWNSGVWGE